MGDRSVKSRIKGVKVNGTQIADDAALYETF